MRIAMISLHTSPADLPGEGDAGGMNVVERQQAEALAALGHEVLFLTRRTDPTGAEVSELGPGVMLRQVVAGPVAVVAKSVVSDHIGAFAAALLDLGEAGIDLVHSQHWMSGMAGLGWARSLGVPHVQSYHSLAVPLGRPLAEGEPAETEERVAGEQLLARESDLVVAISQAEASTIVQRCGADPDRVVVVPPGVDLEQFHPPAGRFADVAPPQGSGRGYVVFAARLQPLKAPELAIAAVAGVPAERRPHLVMVGGVSPDFLHYRHEVERRVAEHQVTDWVSFRGPQSRAQLADLLRGARALLVPSWSETFGLVALEAAASGTPVVANDTGGLREAVVDGVTGLLVSSRDPAAWSAALDRVLSPTEREPMATAAREHAIAFAPELAGQRLVQHYRELLG